MKIRSLAKPLAIAALTSLSLMAPSMLSLGATVAHADGSNLNGGTGSMQGDPPLVIGGGWQMFFFGGVGSFSDTYTFTSSTSTSITVTDAFCTGDRFAIWVDGVLKANTSLPQPFDNCSGPQETGDSDTAYASNLYSHGVITVPAGSHSVQIQAIDSPNGGGGSYLRADPFDSTTPTCTLTGRGVNAAGQPFVQITLSDPDNNLSPTELTELNNGTISPTTNPDADTLDEQIPVTATPTGGLDPAVTTEVLTVTKVNPSLGTQFALVTRDSSLNAITCDPVVTGASRADGKPVTQSVVGIGQADHVVHVYNDAKGVGNLTVTVNGHDYSLHGLGNNQQATLDIGGALHAGTNSVSVKTTGKPGTSATLLFGNI